MGNEDDYKKWLGKASMFMSGFVMLTPHRIALSCAPHVAKRFHLPPATVGLFIYKIHNPMELASLSSTFLSNVLTWINDSTINTMYLKRYCSIIFMWLMALCSVMTYFLFITGDDFGYLQYFYWNMIFFTFINGFASSFGFGVNFNTSMYGAGLPASGGVTFLLHNGYKWLYKKYHWAEYDYNLMIMQMTTTIVFLFFTSILWTADQCWNILEPEYKSFLIKSIFEAANNNAVANPGGVRYTWDNQDGQSGRNDSNLKTVKAAEDEGNKRDKVADKLNDSEKGVVKKLKDYWENTLKRQLTKLWKEEPFKVPVTILTVVGGILGLLFIMGVMIVFKIDEVKPFIIIGISFSILASTSIISTLLRANGHDKDNLKGITGITYEYYNFAAIYESKDKATTVSSEDNSDDTETNAGGNKKIDADNVTAGNHFKTEGTNAEHAPRIRVKTASSIETQAVELAKANIIAVIGICSIVVIFACVLLFSIIIFMGIKIHLPPHFSSSLSLHQFQP